MNEFFEEFDESDLDEFDNASDITEEEEDEDEFDLDDDDDEEFEVDLDDLTDTLSQLSDDDIDFDDDDDFGDDDNEDDGFDSDVLDAISDDDNKTMEDKVDVTPEEELTPDEKKQAADDIAAAVPAMLIKTEMDANESVNFFSGEESEIALNEGLLTEAALDYFMDEVRNIDADTITEATTYGNKTIVRFSKQALLARIRGICIVKCARAHRDPDIPKYAKVCKQRRFYKARMKRKYSREADKQARLIIRRMKQSKSPAIKKLSDKVSGNGEEKK